MYVIPLSCEKTQRLLIRFLTCKIVQGCFDSSVYILAKFAVSFSLKQVQYANSDNNMENEQ